MLIKHPPTIKPSEITAETDYLNRRQLICAAGVMMAGASLFSPQLLQAAMVLGKIRKNKSYALDEVTPYKYATNYNNFFEFSADKEQAKEKAKHFKTTPWSVAVTGHAKNLGVFQLEDLISNNTLEERIYRFRCVEAWSMVVPWVGVPLAQVLKRFQPDSRAKFVRFETLYDPEQMPNQKTGLLSWPYQEALRIDEAMHPLCMLVVGMYGKVLPNQNGAPLRLIVPWKYGFKSIKSIVKIDFTERQPKTTWSQIGENQYGFYANVNPNVSHRLWDQSMERRLGGGIFSSNRKTALFNGYAEVASLYSGMDLKVNF